MTYQQYKSQILANRSWQAKYLDQVPLDTGITSPQGYNIYADPVPPYSLNAAGRASGAYAPMYTNPAANLYAQGGVNNVLLSASNPDCNGCFPGINKPDPRLHSVKPLYEQSVFTAPAGQVLPTVNNVTGMY